MKFSELFDDSDFEFDSSQEIDLIARDTRREALEDALSRTGILDDCWIIFRESMVATIVEERVFQDVIVDARKSVTRAVYETEKDRLFNIAANKLITRARDEVVDAAAKMLLIDNESLTEIKLMAVSLLREQLRAEVESQVKEQLMKDEAFVEGVKRDLKRQIMGI